MNNKKYCLLKWVQRVRVCVCACTSACVFVCVVCVHVHLCLSLFNHEWDTYSVFVHAHWSLCPYRWCVRERAGGSLCVCVCREVKRLLVTVLQGSRLPVNICLSLWSLGPPAIYRLTVVPSDSAAARRANMLSLSEEQRSCSRSPEERCSGFTASLSVLNPQRVLCPESVVNGFECEHQFK